MATNDGIFSIRLVIADFYMEKPITGLDPCYSEFRGKEIKKIPVIRIFGSNAQGQKTCMHVHGVFPYFYIPYDHKDFESVNKAIYQIAINLDKAINISLNQGSSSSQHVFKVQLVKGIPFYGYHRSDHQYLKIYMFNPRFVRRAANLLQNGAIMNKNFHPHESHVPYILQFMIDYNLYGMSFLHVPLEIVKFRRSDVSETIPFKNILESQILEVELAKKLSCSSLEVDIGSSFILNRFQIIAKNNSSHSNPGIESIWNDERLRRQKMAQTLEEDEDKLKTIPPLEIPATQERPDTHATESEIFYRTALLSKLLSMETSLMESSEITDQTINCTLATNTTSTTTSLSNITLNPNNISLKQQKRTFNLSKILQNSVYPEECSQNDNLVNASVIQNHLSNTNIFQQSIIVSSNDTKSMEDVQKITEDEESVFLDDTIIDEELVLSLTQGQNHQQQQQQHVPMNATLREEDMELLDILQQLEENNEDKIDLDSSLAPLSQTHKSFALSPQLLDKETTASVKSQPLSDSESDIENDDNIHDFSIALDNLDDLILKLTQTQKEPVDDAKDNVPQTDGADDLTKTPTKSSKSRSTKSPPRTPTTPKNRRTTLCSPSRSPRTPKTGHKYAPLPLVIINRSTGKKILQSSLTDTTPSKDLPLEKDNLPLVSLRKKLALSEIRRKSISVDSDVQDQPTSISESTILTKRRSKRLVDLDKTHVTCTLSPRRTNEKMLKVYNVENKDNEDIQEIENNENPSKTGDKIKRKENETTETVFNKNDLERGKERYNQKERNVKLIKRDVKQKQCKESKSIKNYTKVTAGELNSKMITSPTNEVELANNFRNSKAKEIDKNNLKDLESECNKNVIKTITNNSDNNAIISANETDEEIIESETEAETSTNSLRKTPNLKRLRRSFLNTNAAKRRRLSKTDLKQIINSSKFENPNVISDIYNDVAETNANTKDCWKSQDYKKPSTTSSSTIPLKIKTCCVRLQKVSNILKKTKVDEITKDSNAVKDFAEKITEKSIEYLPDQQHLRSIEEFNNSLAIIEDSNDISKSASKDRVKENNKRKETKESLPFHQPSKIIEESSSSLDIIENSNEISKSASEDCVIVNSELNETDQMEKLQVSYDLTENFKKSKEFFPHHQFLENIEMLKDSLEVSKNSNDTSRSLIYNTQPSSGEVISKSPLFESSDEEITETPPTNEHPHSKVLSIREKSLTLNSPLLFTQNSSPVFVPNMLMKKTKTPSRSNSLQSEVYITLSSSNDGATNSHSSPPLDAKLALTPLDLPPSRDEVLKGCHKLKLPEFEFQQPFYSNPEDITKHKELGFTILQIPGNKLNDIEEFQSILGTDIKGLNCWRRKELLKSGGPEILNKYRNAQRIREYLSNQKCVAITPQIQAPTRQDIKLWLKARELLKNKEEIDEENLRKTRNEEDSPIKIRRQKVTMMLNDGNGDGDSDDMDNTLNSSSRSLTLTPLTPGTPVVSRESNKEKLKESFTPVTTITEKISFKRNTLLRKRNNRRVLRRVSLTKSFQDALDKKHMSESEKTSQESEKTSQENENKSQESKKTSQDKKSIKDSQESVLPNSQKSETSISSQTALKEMERSSFMRNIQEHDVTIGGCTNNSTLNNTFGFKVALENLQQAKADVEFNYLTVVTLEVFVATRDDFFPNPQIDEIRCLFYAIENSIPNDHIDNDKKLPRKACGYIMVHDSRDIVAKEGRIHGIDRDIEVTIVQTEVEALEALLGLCSRWDPDIYAGYEIEMSSWGFVIERAKYLCLNIAPLLSRVPTQKVRDFVDEERESFTDLDVEMKLCGRILLDVWRLLRSEIALTSYTFENVMYHIMHKRCPWHSYRTLTEWFRTPGSRWIVLEYYLERVRGTLTLLDQLDLIGRTSEMAKLIGIQFYEVLSRGSQFRVESMMLRIAKPKNLIPLSPSVQHRAHMRAPEYLALIMEPESRFYADPLIVLDFQSLYPSMIIGYNYCFSTCLGRVEHLGQSTPFEFGASQLRVSPTMLRKLVDLDLITISPCGVVFVKSSVREGILPRMLTEILDTRQMVKQSMKLHKSNSALQRILHSRQLGLKLMANVTYGYTAANFSGRMPCVEVGDTVVSKGRETLERAIKMVQANDKWNVKVVYGDTDSMFVLVPGRNREEAFRIGEEIAEAVTKQNPHPVKLKLEKVYQPCILQTKKRYVGYMYETPDQKDPVYEAKGIETVRRDGCPVVAKMLEKVLRILFESADVSQVKQYVCRQFTKLLSGRANLQDLIFAKEFRGINGYKPTACVPALELTRKWIQNDPRRIPRRGERVPFIITNGPPGVPLIRLIRHPHEVLADGGLKINAIYYITKAIIPPLNRCLLLIGADVNEWFANLPRKILLTPALSVANEVIACPINTKSKKSTISQFFSTTNCIVDCGRQTKQGICMECNHNPTRSMIVLQSKISKIERSYLSTQQICQACCGRVGDINCDSLDCPVLYVAEVKHRDLQQIQHFRNLLEERF